MATQPQLTERLNKQQFAQRIRERHPGAYDDLSDDDLTNRVITKYPQYKDMLAPEMTAAQQAPILDKMQREQSGGQVTGALREAALLPFKALGFPESQNPVSELLDTTIATPLKFWGKAALSPIQSAKNAPAAAGEVMSALGEPLAAERKKGVEAAKRGQIVEPILRGMTGSVPIIGPMVGKGLETFAQGRAEGSLPEMVRGATDMAAPIAPLSPSVRAASAAGAQKLAQGTKAAGSAIASAPLKAARPLIQRATGTNLEALQQTAALPREVQSTVQASLAAEKAKMRAYAKQQYEPVDAKVGPVPLEPELVAEIQQSLPAKTVADIIGDGDLLAPTLSQTQELKSALFRAGQRSTEPVRQNALLNRAAGLNAKITDVATRAGALPEFQNAQRTFAQYAKDWIESPLADALEATNPSDVVRAFTDKSGAQASQLAQRYGVDTTSLQDFLNLGPEQGTQMLKDAPRLQAQGPRAFADTTLKEIGKERSKLLPYDAQITAGSLIGGAFYPPALGGLGIVAARHVPAALRFPFIRRALTSNLPEEFASVAPEPYAPTVQGEFVQNPAAATTGFIPRPRLPRVGETSTPLNRGTGIPPVAPPTPEGRGLLLPAGDDVAIQNAARDFNSVSLEPQPKALPAPRSGEILPPSRIRQGRAIPLGESNIPQIPGEPDALITGLQSAANVGKGRQTPLLPPPSISQPMATGAGSVSGTPLRKSGGSVTPYEPRRTPTVPRKLEMPPSPIAKPRPPEPSKGSPNAPALAKGETAKFTTKDGKVGVVDKKGKFSVKEMIAELKKNASFEGQPVEILRRFKDSKGFNTVQIKLKDGKTRNVPEDSLD